ncbi:MAG: hypothetical protein ACJAXW_004394 [Candidatus Azotimanducaceae bacterium]|jgi:hypothetical protein
MNIEFTVSYTREEYLSIVTDHVLELSRDKLRKKNPDKAETASFYFTKIFVRLMGSVAFFFKQRKMPVCDFVFTPEKITRTTALGILDVTWAEVVTIAEYHDGMIIFKDSGGMPIPYRCIDDSERTWILNAQKDAQEI